MTGHISVVSDSTMAVGYCAVLDKGTTVYLGPLGKVAAAFFEGSRLLVLNPVDFAQCKDDYKKLIH